MATVRWATPEEATVSTLAWSLTAAAILLLSLFGLVLGLFMLAKMKPTAPLKRMALIGVVIPLGSLLTFGWIAFPLFAFASSIVYAFPATLLVIPITWALRGLNYWVCKAEGVDEDTSTSSD